MVEHLQAAGAAQVARHHGGIAWHVAAEVAADRARHLVDAAADPGADHQVERLAAVEVGDRVRARRAGIRQCGND
jgi:hypothetical protein